MAKFRPCRTAQELAEMQRVYDERCYRKRVSRELAQVLATCFEENAKVIYLTYAPGQDPKDYQKAVCQAKNDFLRPLRYYRKKEGTFFYYLRTTRHAVRELPTEHRFVINAGNESADELRGIWPYGPVLIQTLGEQGCRSEFARELFADCIPFWGSRERSYSMSRCLR